MRNVFAEEMSAVGGNSPLWQTARPLLDAALHLEQGHGTYTWYGWRKAQIDAFLRTLPAHCALVACVWETPLDPGNLEEHTRLILGIVCEIIDGEIHSLRTLETLTDGDFLSIDGVEPGYEDGLKILRVVRKRVAPVAWALFTDEETWKEWIFTSEVGEEAVDKGALLASFVQQGRCVLIGTQARHHS